MLKVKKFFMFETGTYNPQFRRPYETVLNGSTQNTIIERLSGSTQYNPSALGGIANKFITPSAVPEMEIKIANGWGERRMRFMLEIECQSEMGTTISEVILGYSEYVGVSINNHIDPQLVFYVNSTMQVRKTLSMTPLGNQMHTSIIDSSHILANNNWSGAYDSVIDRRMRPEDVYATMTRNTLGLEGGILDTRAMSSNVATKSRRTNSSPANYMAQILNGYTQATNDVDYSANAGTVVSKARDITRENPANVDPFLSAISNVRGTSMVGNSFTFSDLRAIEPNIEYLTEARLIAPTQKTTVHTAGQTSAWHGSDIDTYIANVLSQSVPSLLMDLALTEIVFKTTNRTINSTIITQILFGQGFVDGDISKQLDVFKLRLEYEILKDVSYENTIDFAIEMKVDLLGETWLSLSLNGQPQIDYVTPSFSDALLVPVLTTNDQRTTNLASDFESLTMALLDDNAQRHVSASMGGWKPGSL